MKLTPEILKILEEAAAKDPTIASQLAAMKQDDAAMTSIPSYKRDQISTGEGLVDPASIPDPTADGKPMGAIDRGPEPDKGAAVARKETRAMTDEYQSPSMVEGMSYYMRPITVTKADGSKQYSYAGEGVTQPQFARYWADFYSNPEKNPVSSSGRKMFGLNDAKWWLEHTPEGKAAKEDVGLIERGSADEPVSKGSGDGIDLTRLPNGLKVGLIKRSERAKEAASNGEPMVDEARAAAEKAAIGTPDEKLIGGKMVLSDAGLPQEGALGFDENVKLNTKLASDKKEKPKKYATQEEEMQRFGLNTSRAHAKTNKGANYASVKEANKINATVPEPPKKGSDTKGVAGLDARKIRAARELGLIPKSVDPKIGRHSSSVVREGAGSVVGKGDANIDFAKNREALGKLYAEANKTGDFSKIDALLGGGDILNSILKK